MHWGMHGFNRDPSLRTVYVTTNVSQLADIAGDGDEVNLGSMNIDKLLGSGQINRAINVTVEHASAKAVEKVEAAGGSVTLSADGGEELDEWEDE